MQVQHQTVTAEGVFEAAVYTLDDGRQVAMTIAEDSDGDPISRNCGGAVLVDVNGQIPWVLDDSGNPWVGKMAVITEGLYRSMARADLEFVIMHEIGHVVNGDTQSRACAAVASRAAEEELVQAAQEDTAMEIAADAFAVTQLGVQVANRAIRATLAFAAKMHDLPMDKFIDGMRVANPGRLEALGV
jgi:Peptidase family M48